jgi:ferredoxin
MDLMRTEVKKGIFLIPKINRMECTGCGICSLVCPCGVISCFGSANIENGK